LIYINLIYIQKKIKPYGGKKFQVEAFIEIGYDIANMAPKILVKYTDFDIPEWQPLQHMKDELESTYFELLIKTMQQM